MSKVFKPKIINYEGYIGIHVWLDDMTGEVEQIYLDKKKWIIDAQYGIIHFYPKTK